MSTERRAIELFEAAVDLRPEERADFLDRACTGSPDVRRDVESLLEMHPRAERFLEPESGRAGEHGDDGGEQKFQTGSSFGAYSIVREIGRGGMGVVFEAVQESLGREVALKVLPGNFALDSKRVERFRREARATARIHHPSIVPVYDVGEEDGTHYYAMELVDGPSLDRILSDTRKKVSAKERKTDTSTSDPGYIAGVVERVAEVAEGLAEAHAQGLVHRDIKPSNILVKQNGRYVLADFGLVYDAELQTITHTGEMLGTMLYMSPEQVARRQVDARSDVYSLGATLYEALALRVPFPSESVQTLQNAILFENPPPLRRFNARVNRDLETVVLHCLEKNPDRRYPTAAALADDLRRFLRYEPVRARPQSKTRRLARRTWSARGTLTAGLAVGLALLCGFIGWWLWPEVPLPLANSSTRPLTSFIGLEGGGALSSDGRRLAFDHTGSGSLDVFVLSLENGKPSGMPKRLTDSPYDEATPRWSPDDRELAYVSEQGTGAEICLIASTGGQSRSIARTEISMFVSLSLALRVLGSAPWSPDGKELLYSRRHGGSIAVFKISVGGGESVQITRPGPGDRDLSAAWSPDGSRIVFSRNRLGGPRLWLVSADGGEPAPVFGDDFFSGSAAWWPDGKSVVFESRVSGTLNLWVADLASGRRRRVTAGPGLDKQPSVSRNGRVVFKQFRHTTALIRRRDGAAPPQQLTSNTMDNFGSRFRPPHCREVAYHSTASGNPEIFVLDLSNLHLAPRQLTDHPAADLYPDWSPDGQYLSFVSDREGHRQLHVMTARGENPRRLSDRIVYTDALNEGATLGVGPRWSPDGRVIGFLSPTGEDISLWFVDPHAGREPERSVRFSGLQGFDWYRDRHRVILSRMDRAAGRMLIEAVHLDALEERELLFEGEHAEIASALDGSAISFCRSKSHFTMNLVRMKLEAPNRAGGPPRPGDLESITPTNNTYHVHNGGLSRDGKQVVYTQDTDYGDLSIIEPGGPP